MLLSGHARRSRSAAATQRWMVSPRATFGIESAAAERVCASYRTLPPDENDIEFANVPRSRLRRALLEVGTAQHTHSSRLTPERGDPVRTRFRRSRALNSPIS